jgi:hypothetical protein
LVLFLFFTGIACARVGMNDFAEDEPLPPEASNGQRQRITVLSASYGANCGLPKGNETASLAKRCNGRRHCDKRVKDTIIPSQRNQYPCRKKYEVEWTCGVDQADTHHLASDRAENSVARLRLGCGPENGPVAVEKPTIPKSSTSAGGDAETIHGRVVSQWGVGIPRHRVSIGEQTASTDHDGRFTFHRVPQTYSIKIAERTGGAATAYYGLTRRDPVLGHPTRSFWARESARYHASISGLLSSDGPVLGSYQTPDVVRFLTRPAQVITQERKPVNGEGNSYGTLNVSWRGDAVVRGTLISVVGSGTREQPWQRAYLAALPLTLTDGDAVNEDLHLAEIRTGRIAGSVQLFKAEDEYSQAERLTFSYLIPGNTDTIDLGRCPTTGAYDCELPDLSALGGEYCIAIGKDRSEWETRSIRCGGRMGMRDFSIPPQPPAPVWKEGAGADGDEMLAWTGEGQVYEVKLGGDFSENARVYTTKKSLSWSDFKALGVDFRRGRGSGGAISGVVVAALYPYRSIDDLTSGLGPMAMGSSWQRVSSSKIEVPLPDLSASAPQNANWAPFDPKALPTCTSPGQVKSVGDIRPNMLETQVVLRGLLTLGTGWRCLASSCGPCDTGWKVVDPGGTRGLILQPGESGPSYSYGVLSCRKHVEPTPMDVVATGTLLPYDNSIPWSSSFLPEGGNGYYLLDQASLCAVRPPK